MFPVLYLVVTTGLVVGLVLLVLAVARGRAAPPRRTPWILALVVLGLDSLLHVAATVGMLVAAGAEQFVWTEAAWFIMGTLGFLAILAVAVLRPRWAGWALLASAAAVPLVFALGGLLTPGVTGPDAVDAAPPWPVALVAYSVPAVLSGSLLVLSTTTRKGTAGQVTVGSVPHAVH
jgi:hypothetical protein